MYSVYAKNTCSKLSLLLKTLFFFYISKCSDLKFSFISIRFLFYHQFPPPQIKSAYMLIKLVSSLMVHFIYKKNIISQTGILLMNSQMVCN